MIKKPTSDKDFIIVLAMIIMMVIPVALTVRSIRVPDGKVFHLSTGTASHSIVAKATHKQIHKSPLDDSPFGYTWSLSLFIAPIIVIWSWLHLSFKDKLIKKTFWLTFGILTPVGFLLDIVFGDLFFIFPNKGAYLGIYLPAYDFEQSAWKLSLPIEEFIFYATGFMAILSIHMWCDEHWFGAYNKHNYSSEEFKAEVRKHEGIIKRLHIPSLIFGAILIIAAVFFKKYGDHAYKHGFPGYFTFLVVIAIVPAAAFFHTAKKLINWRAFSFTFFFFVMISLIWEATLANPYGWWWYNINQMMGLVIEPWSAIPIEASILWVAVTFTTVIIYYTIKIWLLSGKTFRKFFLG